jgi:hypothetical protein
MSTAPLRGDTAGVAGGGAAAGAARGVGRRRAGRDGDARGRRRERRREGGGRRREGSGRRRGGGRREGRRSGRRDRGDGARGGASAAAREGEGGEGGEGEGRGREEGAREPAGGARRRLDGGERVATRREQGRGEGAHRRVAARAVGLEAAVDGLGHRGGGLGREVAQRRGAAGEHLRHHLVVVGAGEGGRPGEGLVEDDAHGPDVRAGVEVALAAGLLGGHVARGADDGAGAGDGGAGEVGLVDARDAEIDEAREGAVGRGFEEDVLGLHVAVDDAGVVGGGERVEQGPEEREGLVHGEPTAAPEVAAEVLAVGGAPGP